MRAALFLDRDGVINIDHGYVHTPDGFEFLPGVFDTVKLAIAQGLAVIVVTNQAGIARGYYTDAQFQTLTAWMGEQFIAHDAPLTAVYHCPYHPDGKPPYTIASHPDRKPNPGMLLRAASEHAINLANSFIIGDQESDMEAGRRAGLTHLGLFGHEAGSANDVVCLPDHQHVQAWLTAVTKRFLQT